MRLASGTIEIDAPAERVFELFTTEAGLCQWMARDASVDLRLGGAWRWVHDDGAACSGEYLEIEPPSRLVFTYGWESGRFDDVPPGSTRVEVTFESADGRTRVHVDHAGLVGPTVDAHVAGWNHFLGVLADVVAGRPRTPYTPDD